MLYSSVGRVALHQIVGVLELSIIAPLWRVVDTQPPVRTDDSNEDAV